MLPADASARRAYQAATSQVRQQISAHVESTWMVLADYRDTNITSWVTGIVPVVTAGQRASAYLTSAHLAQIAGNHGHPARPVPVAKLQVTNLRGVPATEVYQRAGNDVWYALSQGAPIQEASQRGLDRALILAATDLQMARVRAARDTMLEQQDQQGGGGDVLYGYERVIGSANPCELCVDAATQTYHVADLQPIHPGCFCDPEPLYGPADNNPDLIHPDQLADNYDGEGTPPDYVVHGEIGPMLVPKGANVLPPEDT